MSLPGNPEEPLPPPPTVELMRPETEHFKRLYMNPSSLRRLAGDYMLNDEGIYAGMSVLADLYPARLGDIAFFDTFEYKRWCDNQVTLPIVKSVRKSRFWTKDVIILPVHDPDMLHWLLAIIYPKQGQIEFFDSLASSSSNVWRVHGKVCVCRFCTHHQMTNAPSPHPTRHAPHSRPQPTISSSASRR